MYSGDTLPNVQNIRGYKIQLMYPLNDKLHILCVENYYVVKLTKLDKLIKMSHINYIIFEVNPNINYLNILIDSIKKVGSSFGKNERMFELLAKYLNVEIVSVVILPKLDESELEYGEKRRSYVKNLFREHVKNMKLLFKWY